MKRLIINADDFGLTHGVNAGVFMAHTNGLVSSASMLAGGNATPEAIALARSCPSLSLGCHVVVIKADSLPPCGYPNSLAHGANGRAPRFRHNQIGLTLAALTRQMKPDDIYDEAVRQIRQLQAASLEITHVDSHGHTHMLPQVLEPLLAAAKACGVAAIRNPYDPLVFTVGDWFRLPTRLKARYGAVAALRLGAQRFRQSVAKAGLQTTDGCIGVVYTGNLTEPRFADIIAAMPEGTWELVCHPAHVDSDLRRRSGLNMPRVDELRTLTTDSARTLLRHTGVRVISYRDFLATAQPQPGRVASLQQTAA
jgi:predicted glycoside hydrolase/deacetylase ChbG (UPF0249 family)